MQRLRIPFFLLFGLILAGLSSFAYEFAPEEQVWCDACRSYVDAGHLNAHQDLAGFGFCAECEGFFSGVEDKSHIHIGQPPSGSPSAQLRETGARDSESAAGDAESAYVQDGGDGEALSLLRKAPMWAWALLAGLFGIFLFIPLVVNVKPKKRIDAKPKKRDFPFVNGVPQGIVLKRGSLVCTPNDILKGGTSQVYEARFYQGDEWKPAFVKRIVGKGMSPNQHFPMIQFEAGVLNRLRQTGAVPLVLVEPETVVLSDGSNWSYYAMSAAQGAPWPEHGGLGGDTRKALAILCERLMNLHEQGIGHHDLKPQNIFWDSRNKRITFLDFGSAIDHRRELVNPISDKYPKSLPWVAPPSDGKMLAELTALSDNWVYGLLFCEAILGCIKAEDRTQRHTPRNPEDLAWLRKNLARETSQAIADAVVDGLFEPDKSRRMKLRDFLDLLHREWKVHGEWKDV